VIRGLLVTKRVQQVRRLGNELIKEISEEAGSYRPGANVRIWHTSDIGRRWRPGAAGIGQCAVGTGLSSCRGCRSRARCVRGWRALARR
jgi:hypothetical protein